jgi:hypothetical protein
MRSPIVAVVLAASYLSVPGLLAGCKKEDDTAVADDERAAQKKRERREALAVSKRREAYDEATRNLGSIEVGCKASFQMETDSSGVGTGPFVHAFCPSAKSPVPATVPRGVRVLVDPKEWEPEAWKCLKYSVNKEMLCQYAFESSGTGMSARYKATAVCDPDGTGEKATFVLEGAASATGEAVRLSFTKPPDA